MLDNNEIKYNIEKNLIQFFLIWKNSKNIEYYEDNNFCFINNETDLWPKFILNTSVNSNNFSDNLTQITNLLKNNKAPKYWLVNSDLTQKFSPKIRGENFVPIVKWIGMYMNIKEKPNFTIPNNFTIQKVTDKKQLKIWLKIVNDEVYNKENLKPYFFEDALDNKSVHIYLGSYNNIPVATSLLYTKDNYSGLYMISTKTKYRKKGFGTAITNYAIAKAVETGTTKFVLHATKVGKPIYERIGFAEFNNIYIFTYI